MAKAPRKEIGYEERKRTHDLSTNTDYNAEMEMSYAELVKHLLSKYGSSKEDYFTNESCSTPNPLAKRSKEGLICHHIDEDKVANLSNKEVAINNPYDYQKADRLVYCNLLEHLLLHITITLEVPHSLERKRLGAGGAVNYMCKDFNHFYSHKMFGPEFGFYQVDQMDAVQPEKHFDEYIKMMKKLYNYFQEDPLLSEMPDSAEVLSCDRDDEVVDIVYRALTK